MRTSFWGSIGLMAILFGVASGVSAQDQAKSWEVDLYDDEAEITYVPDGRDDVHVYDHNNPLNDRSYIEVDRPGYRYPGAYYDEAVVVQIDSGRYDRRYDRRYDHYSRRRAYAPRYYRPAPRYRVEYHHGYRGW